MLGADHFAPARQVLGIVQSIVGPTRAMNDINDARTKGDWLHHGEYRGRPLRFVLIHRYTSQAVGRLGAISLSAPLGRRPIELSIDIAPLVNGQLPAPLPNNEQSLLPHGLVTGFPADVVRAALDPQTVATINASIGTTGLLVETSGDWLSVQVKLDAPSSGFTAMQMPDAAHLKRMLDFVFDFAERLGGAFDQAHASVLQSGGPAAAAQWLAAQHHAGRQRAETRQRGTIVAVAVAIVVMLVIVGLIIIIAVFAKC